MSHRPLLRLASTLAFLGGLLATAGCGGKDDKEAAGKTVVTGKLVDNGKPFGLDASRVPLPKGAHSLPPGLTSLLKVTFIATESKEIYEADVNPEAGTFEVKGTDGKGIKPGRYRIAVTGRVGISPDTPDFFKGKFAPEKTQILRDVKPGDEIVIDVSKVQG